MDGNSLMNCTNISRDEILRAAAARSITAAACLSVTALILLAVVFVRAFEIFLERLLVYITAITVWALSMEIMHIRPYDGLSQFCAAMGFFDQWAAISVLIFTFAVTFVILCSVCSCKCPPTLTGRTKKLLEAGFVVILIVLPLPFIWIPFLDGNYSSDVEPWCWIKTHNMDCSENDAGFWEQISLFYAPFGVLGLLIVLFALLTIGVFCKRAFTYEQKRRQINLRAAETVILLVFLLLFGTFAGIEASSSLYFGFTKKPQGYTLLMIHAIITPVYKLLIPVGFVFQLHSLKKFKREEVKEAVRKWKRLCSCCCKLQIGPGPGIEGTLSQQATIRSSFAIIQPSVTTFQPSHPDSISKFTDGDNPSINNYGSCTQTA